MPDLARQARERFALREAATFGPTADQAAEENLLVRHHVLYNYLTIKTIDFSSSSSSAYIWGRESPGHALDNMRAPGIEFGGLNNLLSFALGTTPLLLGKTQGCSGRHIRSPRGLPG